MNATSNSTDVARRRLITIGLGWASVAVFEAIAYTTLALAIVEHRSPAMVLATAVIALFVTVLVSRAGYFTGARLVGDLYDALGNALNRAKLSWFTESNRALLATVAGQGIPSLTSVPAHQLQTFLVAPLTPLLLLVGTALVAGPGVMLLVGVLLAVSLAAQLLAQRALSRADARRHDAEHAATQATLELTDHLELLRTAAGPTGAVTRIEQSWLLQEQALARTNRAAVPATFVSAVASVLPLVGVVIYLAANGFEDPALALALFVLTARACAPLEELALAGIGVNELAATVRDYRTVTSAPALPEPHARDAARPAATDIEIIGLGHGSVLRDVDAQIPAGERVLVAGRSGTGKSTLLGLLMRFDDPDHGRITIGGIDLREIRYDDLAAHIGYVPQDPIVFSGTLAANIGIGRPGATAADIEGAARKALLGPVLDRSALGISQDVGHQGAALSGGERQRVALARAFLDDAPVLVLDEATSALDETTEQLIADAVRGLEATVFVVTHRDSTIWEPTRTIEL
ncbi:ATP-binding cassette subfamily B protein [Rhodococcus sp. 27YEA15]|uniref:ABC transporter ATP-binding protein n=1 Tax=Rhodococcus sp. 27YEA15 TaxID=3156259 RepID=UPI003C7E062A